MAGENNATTNDALQPFLGRELLGQASSQASLVHVFNAALPQRATPLRILIAAKPVVRLLRTRTSKLVGVVVVHVFESP
jgi:hypothetical protein